MRARSLRCSNVRSGPKRPRPPASQGWPLLAKRAVKECPSTLVVVEPARGHRQRRATRQSAMSCRTARLRHRMRPRQFAPQVVAGRTVTRVRRGFLLIGPPYHRSAKDQRAAPTTTAAAGARSSADALLSAEVWTREEGLRPLGSMSTHSHCMLRVFCPRDMTTCAGKAERVRACGDEYRPRAAVARRDKCAQGQVQRGRSKATQRLR